MKVAEFKDRIKEGLLLRHMTKTELCQASGVPKSSLSHYVSGRCVPKRDAVINLAKALRVNFMWLLGHDVSYEMPSDRSVNTEQIIEGLRENYGERAVRLFTNYLMLNEYGQLKVADFIQNLLVDKKYRSEI